jgi:pyruvate-formate lyase-activating enzyme
MYSKIHRCGWCGNPTTKDGVPLEGEDRERTIAVLEKYGDYRTHKEHGECCVYDEMMRQEQSRMVQVTREMAHDAGMPEIEGSWTKW